MTTFALVWKFLIIAVGVAAAASVVAILIHDLWRGKTSFGGWHATRTNDRNVYWTIISFYVAGMMLLFIVTARMGIETMGCDPDVEQPCSAVIRVNSK